MSEEFDIQGRFTRIEERLLTLEQADAENKRQIKEIFAQRPAQTEPPHSPSYEEIFEPTPVSSRVEVPAGSDPALQKLEQDLADARRDYGEVVQKTAAKESELNDFEERSRAVEEKIRTAVEELARKQSDLQAIEDEIKRTGENLTRDTTELSALQEKLRAANEELRRSQDALSAHKRSLQAANEELARTRSEQTALKRQANAELEQARKNHQQVIKEYEAVKARTERERTSSEAFQLQIKEAAAIRERIWPPWMLTSEFATWKRDLETGLLASDSPPSNGLLFAAIHSHNAAMRDADPKILIDSLRDIGKRLYAWLRDRGLSEEQSAEASEEWGKAINNHCAGAAKVDIPRPGNAAEVSWMSFQPRGGSAPDVVSVRNWCVRDSQSRPAHRAEVIV